MFTIVYFFTLEHALCMSFAFSIYRVFVNFLAPFPLLVVGVFLPLSDVLSAR